MLERCVIDWSAVTAYAAHWSNPGFESTVVTLNAIIGVLLGVVKRLGDQLVDDSQQWCSQICGDLTLTPMDC